MYGPLRHYTDGALDGVVVDPRFGTDATPAQPSGWGGGASLPLVEVSAHGAVGDGREGGAGFTVNASSTSLVSTATLTPADVGKTIWLSAPDGAFHKSTITNHSPKTIASAPSVNISDAVAFIGTDNGTAITSAVNAATAFGQAGVQFGPGLYLTDTPLPALIRTRDFRISGASGGGMSYGIYNTGGQPMDRMPGTELLFLGPGSGTVIDASYTRGFRLDNMAVRVAHPSFTGTILDLHKTWASYIDHFVLGGVWYGVNATVVKDADTVETQFTDGMIERAAVGHDATGASYANANTYTRVVWLACDVTMQGAVRYQATFLSCVFEATGGSMNTDPLADASPITGTLHGATFVGCGWWDAKDATGTGWLRPGAGSSITILGGYFEPLSGDDVLVHIPGGTQIDSLTVHGLRSKRVHATGTSKLLALGSGAAIKNLDFRGNSFADTSTVSGLDTLTSGVAYEPDSGFHRVIPHGTVTSTLPLRTAATQSATLGGNASVTFPSMVPGSAMTIDLFVTQDATGGRSLTWPGSARHDGGTAPTLDPAAGAVTHLQATTVNGGSRWLVRKAGSYAA